MAAKTHLRNKVRLSVSHCATLSNQHPVLSLLQDWQSDYSLFESGVAVMPSNVKLRNNYGMELKAVGRVAEAVAQYKVVHTVM